MLPNCSLLLGVVVGVGGSFESPISRCKRALRPGRTISMQDALQVQGSKGLSMLPWVKRGWMIKPISETCTTCTHTHNHTHTYTTTHTNTHRHVYTYTQAHTHTHTPALRPRPQESAFTKDSHSTDWVVQRSFSTCNPGYSKGATGGDHVSGEPWTEAGG